MRGKLPVNRHGVAKSARKPGNFPSKITYQKKQTDIIPAHLVSIIIFSHKYLNSIFHHNRSSQWFVIICWDFIYLIYCLCVCKNCIVDLCQIEINIILKNKIIKIIKIIKIHIFLFPQVLKWNSTVFHFPLHILFFINLLNNILNVTETWIKDFNETFYTQSVW